MRLAAAASVLLSMLLACAGALAQNPCAAPDNLTRVDGNGKCLVLRTFTPAMKKQDALAVWIHGDVSSGGPADYMNGYASAQAERYGITAVVLIRPGYADRDGNGSAGSNNGRRDSYTEENVDAVSAALLRLKKHHGAGKLLVIGHSGGAAIAAAALARHPGTIDVAYLFACPCNIAAWKPDWYQSVSPIAVVDRIPPSSRVYAYTGSRDGNTGPGLARAYVAALTARGVTAEFNEIPDQSHNMNPAMLRFDRFVDAQNRELAEAK